MPVPIHSHVLNIGLALPGLSQKETVVSQKNYILVGFIFRGL